MPFYINLNIKLKKKDGNVTPLLNLCYSLSVSLFGWLFLSSLLPAVVVLSYTLKVSPPSPSTYFQKERKKKRRRGNEATATTRRPKRDNVLNYPQIKIRWRWEINQRHDTTKRGEEKTTESIPVVLKHGEPQITKIKKMYVHCLRG